MNPRRLHKLTIFSMCWASTLEFINRIYSATDLHRLHRFPVENSVAAAVPAAFSRFCTRYSCRYSICVLTVIHAFLRLPFHGCLRLDLVGDETLLVRHRIHLLAPLLCRLFIACNYW